MNRERAREGLSPQPSPKSMPEPDDDSSSDDVDYSMFKDLDTGVARGQLPVQH